MNWLYPRTALDMIFPSLFWYLCVWVVMGCVFVGALCWDLCVVLYRWGNAAMDWWDRRHSG